MHVSLRAKILAAILATVIVSDALAAWVVNDRLTTGARQEVETQARAQAAQAQAVYLERAATLAAEGEAVSLYPAVIAALAGSTPKPLLQWSSQVAALQGTDVTVTDGTGLVLARGRAPQRVGDNLAPHLVGLRQALAGQKVSGVEDGDELGLAIRGYAPVRQNGAVVGAVMIADPLDDTSLQKLLGSAGSVAQVHVEPGAASAPDHCDVLADGSTAACRFALTSPEGKPAATLALTVTLSDVEQARVDAERRLWLTGVLILLAGAALAWLLARSLTRPLAQLTGAAERIAGGDYDRPVAVRATDEIGTLARAFETMRARVAAVTAALRDERDVLGSVLESTEDGILMVDWGGATVVANSRWTDLVGNGGLEPTVPLARVGGSDQTFAEVTRGWLADRDYLGGADFEQREPYRRLRCYSAAVRPREGAPLGRIFVLRDVTRETEAERMRGALVATVSHELRSPLTAIAGYTDTLLEGGPWDEATTHDFLEIVSQSAAKLARLVDNLLDAAKMEVGVLRLEREPVRLERLAQEVLEQRRALVPSHPLQLEVEPDLPLVDGDPLRLEQVLANLVDNAIKYSPDGGPVTLRLAHRSPGAIAVSVADRGIGISAAHCELLFERFYRVDNSLARTTKGVGLGLFICKGIVEAHGGRISVTSEPGRGSTFTFTLRALIDDGVERGAAETEVTSEIGRLPRLVGEVTR